MKIVKVEDFHADAGWRTASFLKVTTDEGLVGWSEFHETAWNPGLTLVIRKMAEHAIGQDPRRIGHLSAVLWAITRMVPGGTNQQAIGALENACLDIKAKAQGVPVCALFSGPYRDRVDLYWSHLGTFRVRDAAFFERVIGTPPLRRLDDFTTLAKQARAEGWKAVKTNPIVFTDKGPVWLNSGFPKDGLDLGGNWNLETVDGIAEQMAAVREGLGPHVGLMLDLNFGMKPEGFTQVSRAVEPYGLTWLEMDVHDPQALADVRRATKVPVGSLEAVFGRRGYRPYFEARAVDVAIVDVIWNGFLESVRIAEMAESYEINVAPHNFYGHLANLISAHFAAAVPNFKLMEYEVDDVAWKADFVTVPPVIENGALVLPTTPGWGTEVNEEALRAHPPKVKR